MNFLALAQRLRQEMNDSGEGPAQVTGQRGRNLEYVNAIREAWLDIQQCRPWAVSFWQQGFSPDKLQILENTVDTPFIPAQYHLAIVFYAMQSKAISQNAQELILRGQQEWDKYLHLLCRDFLPTLKVGR
ncbi:hypothetical protein FWK45_02150 [Histophilus somni]|uniref:Uncharacterized protein n=1 Tax=Histophilus somni TaxID=731 RepID=A0AAX2S1Q7_HISSO|nr:hypothetical protein [Histophilus somni]ACA32589.1 Haemophilus-specific protein, uncharacterized [Histophilus somni 2336]QEH50658.1 hypothetical protein FWK45_02150 [Histophilus somni]QQF85744.1 hypothetical protein JFL55_08195 [Histophilus somni]QQJ90444.1 hypothetical protein JFJ84_02170 [Histophilus somni]TEW29078.1 hypothetical protein E2R48_07690 [Histophilus somni]